MRLTPGLCGHLACVLEVAAPKAGNVHPGRAFADTTYRDFLLSAAAVAPALDRASSVPAASIGQTVLDAVRATRAVTRSNTNLGICLLLAPLASVFEAADYRGAVARRLSETTVDDARLAFEAIRLAAPGGLGEAARQDVREEPSLPLVEIMALAAERDLVARQYRDGFHDVFALGVESIRASRERDLSLAETVGRCHLEFLARFPDSLIARRCGDALAEEASARARDVLAAGWPGDADARERFARFDNWLRADGNRRNPGTSADLTAASLFVALRDGGIRLTVAGG